MAAHSVIHPSPDSLRAFALGKMDATSAGVLIDHLDQCQECRKVVAALSGDGFLERIRQTHDQNAIPTPVKPLPPPLPKPVNSSPKNLTPLPDLPPELAGHPQYEILRELGRGGMGVVYLAKNKLMDRLEVLKVVNKALLDRPSAVERFLREIRSAAKLSHANVVGAYSALQVGDLLAFAMEYVEGEDLAVVVDKHGPLPIAHACYYVQQAALGLQHAFEKGMIHRDIKPQNLILARVGKAHVVKVLDFGLAKVAREKAEDTGLTGAGKMMGTPDYMAPEQSMDAASADIRADIYSLGCTLYHLLAGVPPFEGRSLYQVLHAHQSLEATLLNVLRPEVPEVLAAVVAKMMAKQPAHRYQTPMEVARALDPIVKGSLKSSPPPAVPAPAGQRVTASQSLLLRETIIQGRDTTVKATKIADATPSRKRLAVSLAVALLLAGLVGLCAILVLRVKTPDTATQGKTPLAGDTSNYDRTGGYRFVHFGADGTRVVLRFNDDKQYFARVYDRATGQALTPPLTHENSVLYASFSPDGRRVITASADNTARLWDAASGKEVTPPLNHEDWVRHASFSPDGRRVITASADKTARLWDAATGKEVTSPLKHEGYVSHASFSPDGRRVVTASYDKTARLWDAASGKEVTPPLTHEDWVRHASFSPDGKRVVTASDDKTARLWDAATGKEVTAPLNHKGTVYLASFSPDGRRVVTVSDDKTARLWDAATGKQVTPPLNHEGYVVHASFSPDGKRVVTAGYDKTARVWDTANGREVTPPLNHEDFVRHASFSPDSRRVVTAGDDNTARLWDAATGAELKKITITPKLLAGRVQPPTTGGGIGGQRGQGFNQLGANGGTGNFAGIGGIVGQGRRKGFTGNFQGKPK